MKNLVLASRASVADFSHNKVFPLVVTGSPNHDELQALVAGLAGIALEHGQYERVTISGQAPELLDGYWREGFIVNPRRP